jgi:hypothetical protein
VVAVQEEYPYSVLILVSSPGTISGAVNSRVYKKPFRLQIVSTLVYQKMDECPLGTLRCLLITLKVHKIRGCVSMSALVK